MATITLTDYYAQLNRWQGSLLDAPNGTVVTSHTATSYAFTYPAGDEYAGFVVSVTGTGFTFDGTVPIGGTMTGLVITDESGHTVITIAGLAANTVASDLAWFSSNVFGWSDGNGGGQGPQSDVAWSTLLSGNDTINGTEGNDNRTLAGFGAGNDIYNLMGGDDNIDGDTGSDTINGGDGWDSLWYANTAYNIGATITRGISVDVTAGTVMDAWGYTDHVTGIEQYAGTVYNDTFLGSVGNDRFMGLRGIDTLNGGSGGSDYAVYDSDHWYGGLRGIVVNLEVTAGGGFINGTIRDGFGNVDKTINIENVIGTVFDDRFVGSSAQNTFVGNQGKDTYNGGAGSDTVGFWWDGNGAVTVDLSLTTGQIKNDGYGNTEKTISIENVAGSFMNDKIKGSSGANVLEGVDGKDTLTGGGGADHFSWIRTSDMDDTDVITDFVAATGANHDVLEFNMTRMGLSTTLHLVNGSAATQAVGTFIFNHANHMLYWDDDGTGSDAKMAVALLSGVTALTADDFSLV